MRCRGAQATALSAVVQEFLRDEEAMDEAAPTEIFVPRAVFVRVVVSEFAFEDRTSHRHEAIERK